MRKSSQGPRGLSSVKSLEKKFLETNFISSSKKSFCSESLGVVVQREKEKGIRGRWRGKEGEGLLRNRNYGKVEYKGSQIS
jgi:hypothetical protein